jgi:hypothetical protein
MTRSLARYGTVAAAVAAAVSVTAAPASARTDDAVDAIAARMAAKASAVPAAVAARRQDADEPVPAPGPVPVARYSFDGPGGIVVDDSGYGHTLRTRAGHRGRVRVVAHAAGKALAFPKKCAGAKCAKVVLQAADAAELNPGAAPIAFGATVRLARRQATEGQNVVQKGYSAGGSQYKLQIDGAAGKPSCALVDEHTPAIRRVKSSVTVADSRWHRIECRRIGAALSIVVDDVARGTTVIPDALSVLNTAPLSIGGKGGYQDNDQFQGMLDDVWVAVG